MICGIFTWSQKSLLKMIVLCIIHHFSDVEYLEIYKDTFPESCVTSSYLVRSPDMLIFILGELEFSWFNLFKGRSLLILLILIIILFLLKRSTNKFNNLTIYQQRGFLWNSCILSTTWIHINTDRTQDVVFSILRGFSFTITLRQKPKGATRMLSLCFVINA